MYVVLCVCVCEKRGRENKEDRRKRRSHYIFFLVIGWKTKIVGTQKIYVKKLT